MHTGNLTLASKRRRRPSEKPDGPTPERLEIAGLAYERGDTGTYTLRDAPAERLLARGAITRAQYDAAMKYRLHWYHGGLSVLQSPDPNRIFATDSTNFANMAKSEAQAFHRQQYRAAQELIGLISGSVLDGVVCEELSLEQVGYKLGWGSKPQAIAAATERVKQALTTLTNLWGMA